MMSEMNAFRKASQALDHSVETRSELTAHERECALRQGQLRDDIKGVKTMLSRIGWGVASAVGVGIFNIIERLMTAHL
jgi:hypothetical protein